jgi:hypothetical protein
LAPHIANVTGSHSIAEVVDFMNGKAKLDVINWQFVFDCGSAPAGSYEISGDCESSQRSPYCGLCISLEIFNQTLHAIAQLPPISIGLMSETSSE